MTLTPYALICLGLVDIRLLEAFEFNFGNNKPLKTNLILHVINIFFFNELSAYRVGTEVDAKSYV